MSALIRIQIQSYKTYAKQQTCQPLNVNHPFSAKYGKNVSLLRFCQYEIMS